MTTTPNIHSKTNISSVEEIRSQFPALQRIHKGNPVAYFDGPGGTQVPRYVVDKMSDYLFHHNANTHWAYPTSVETDAALEYARETLADLVNAAPTEIAFGANMTTLTYHLSRALSLNYGPTDEIVITELDHHANIDPWRRLAIERGVKVHTVRLNIESGQLEWGDLERYINRNTRVVAIGAASNALGTINDIQAAVKMAHDVGALAFVDAVHYAPHVLPDVRAIDCDFLAMSAYKFYGPHVGVLYGKRDLLQKINFPRLVPAPDYAPENAETGTQNQEGMVGAAAAVNFLASLAHQGTRRERLNISYQELHARNVKLFNKLWNGLTGIKGVRLYGPSPDKARTPTLSMTIDGVDSRSAAQRLAEKGLFLSHGDFYAATVVERLGVANEGLLRVGCACYSSESEIDRLLEGISEL